MLELAYLSLGRNVKMFLDVVITPILETYRCKDVTIQINKFFYGSIPGGMTNFSDGAQSSFMETCLDRIKNDATFDKRFVVATRWMFLKPALLWILPFHSESIELNKNFKFLFNQFNSFLYEHSIDESSYTDMKSRVEYLSGLFCRNENKSAVYRVTATFHNEVIRTFNDRLQDKLQGLIFPSANTKGEGMNVVLNKDFINEENIRCDHAVLYYFQRDPRNIMDISFLPIASCEPKDNGAIDFEIL